MLDLSLVADEAPRLPALLVSGADALVRGASIVSPIDPEMLTPPNKIAAGCRRWPTTGIPSASAAAALSGEPRQRDMMSERLFDQIERIDEDADAGESPGLEPGEMRHPQADWLVGIERGQRVAQHRRRRLLGQHHRLPIEAMNPDIFRNLPDDLQYGGLAAPGAEKRKHIDRAENRPIDVLVDQAFDIGVLALIDRAMQRA